MVVRSLFEPPPFQSSKLSISFAHGATSLAPAPPEKRRYTLTHNDITGQLWLTVGAEYNSDQISGFYTRLLRDEVIGEWQSDVQGQPSLHLFCHVSGEERWLAPPTLRNYIFRREMPLVLDCVIHAERELLKHKPQLAQAKVFVHFQSSLQALDSIECWGVLGDRDTWQAVPTSILKRLLYGIVGQHVDQPSASLQSQPPSTQVSANNQNTAGSGLSTAYSLTPVVAAAALELDADDLLVAEAMCWQDPKLPEMHENRDEGDEHSCNPLVDVPSSPALSSKEHDIMERESNLLCATLGATPSDQTPAVRQARLAECLEDHVSGSLNGSLLLGAARKQSELTMSRK